MRKLVALLVGIVVAASAWADRGNVYSISATEKPATDIGLTCLSTGNSVPSSTVYVIRETGDRVTCDGGVWTLKAGAGSVATAGALAVAPTPCDTGFAFRGIQADGTPLGCVNIGNITTPTDSTANQPGDPLSWFKMRQIPADIFDGDQVGGDVSSSVSSAVDNAIARMDGTGGKTIQGSTSATLDDLGNVTFKSLNIPAATGLGSVWTIYERSDAADTVHTQWVLQAGATDLLATRVCTLNSLGRIPDDCVGDGSDGGGSTPTGTGVRKVVAGVEAGTALPIVDADVSPTAAIHGGKIALASGLAKGVIDLGPQTMGSGLKTFPDGIDIPANATSGGSFRIYEDTDGDDTTTEWGFSLGAVDLTAGGANTGGSFTNGICTPHVSGRIPDACVGDGTDGGGGGDGLPILIKGNEVTQAGGVNFTEGAGITLTHNAGADPETVAIASTLGVSVDLSGAEVTGLLPYTGVATGGAGFTDAQISDTISVGAAGAVAEAAVAGAIARDDEVPSLETDPGVPLLALASYGDVCAAGESVRRNVGDTANECYVPTVGGEANTTADVGAGAVSIRGTTPKSGVALNLRTFSSQFATSLDVISLASGVANPFGSTIGASEVDADMATQAELDAKQAITGVLTDFIALDCNAAGKVAGWNDSTNRWQCVDSGGPASGTFAGLTDGPGALAGNGLKIVRVNTGATALEYAAGVKLTETTPAPGHVIVYKDGTDEYVNVPVGGDGTLSASGSLSINDDSHAHGGSTITNGTVALADLVDLAQDQFIGRTTASTGPPQTATITAQARTVLDDVSVAAMVDTLGGAASTGTGGIARATSPTFVTPNIGNAVGNISGNANGNAGSATYSNAVATADALDVNAAHYPWFGTATSGNLPGKTDSSYQYNPNTNTLSAEHINGEHEGTLDPAVTATTQSAGDNSTKVATTAYVRAGFQESNAYTLTVCASGCDYATIQTALDSGNGTSSQPRVILVHPGLYAECLIVDHNNDYTALVGESRETTRVSCVTASTAALEIDYDSGDIESFEVSGLSLLKDTTGYSTIHSSAISTDFRFDFTIRDSTIGGDATTDDFLVYGTSMTVPTKAPSDLRMYNNLMYSDVDYIGTGNHMNVLSVGNTLRSTNTTAAIQRCFHTTANTYSGTSFVSNGDQCQAVSAGTSCTSTVSVPETAVIFHFPGGYEKTTVSNFIGDLLNTSASSCGARAVILGTYNQTGAAPNMEITDSTFRVVTGNAAQTAYGLILNQNSRATLRNVRFDTSGPGTETDISVDSGTTADGFLYLDGVTYSTSSIAGSARVADLNAKVLRKMLTAKDSVGLPATGAAINANGEYRLFDAAADEQASWRNLRVSDYYQSGSLYAPSFKIYWLPDTDNDGGAAVWRVGACSVADGTTFPCTVSSFTSVTDTAPTTTAGKVQMITGTLPTGLLTAGNALVITVSRDADNGSDTLTGDATLVGVEISYGVR